jgi:hypothetical protein
MPNFVGEDVAKRFGHNAKLGLAREIADFHRPDFKAVFFAIVANN